jgi:hypothetical protein
LPAQHGGLAQLARACDWQSQGQGFDSPNLHNARKNIPDFYAYYLVINKCQCLKKYVKVNVGVNVCMTFSLFEVEKRSIPVNGLRFEKPIEDDNVRAKGGSLYPRNA